MENIIELIKDFSNCKEVEGIALGGSRATGNNDVKSDYDVYTYIREPFAVEKRKAILEKYCSYMEIDNAYWEVEDDCVLNSGTVIEIIYRTIEDTDKGLEETLERYEARNGYTTCIWHNVITCKILYDEAGKLQSLKEKYSIPYPKQLKENIITKNLSLLEGKIPSYDLQIKKAVERGDIVSINHRITEFLASYFDIIFALNEQMHPGEKRLISLCEKNCECLPENFKVNLETLLTSQNQPEKIMEVLLEIIRELRKIVGLSFFV